MLNVKKKKRSENIFLELFLTFFRIGTFTIGGGYAMIPLIQREVVNKKHWIDEKEFIDMLAMAQSAPGVIAVNTAIFVGYKIRGFKGSLASVLGASLPSFTMILVIAVFFSNFRENPVVNSVFKGIRPAVVALIVAPLYNMGKAAGITWKTAIIPIAVALLIWKIGISPVLIVLLAIVGGILYGVIHSKKITS